MQINGGSFLFKIQIKRGGGGGGVNSHSTYRLVFKHLSVYWLIMTLT